MRVKEFLGAKFNFPCTSSLRLESSFASVNSCSLHPDAFCASSRIAVCAPVRSSVRRTRDDPGLSRQGPACCLLPPSPTRRGPAGASSPKLVREAACCFVACR